MEMEAQKLIHGGGDGDGGPKVDTGRWRESCVV